MRLTYAVAAIALLGACGETAGPAPEAAAQTPAADAETEMKDTGDALKATDNTDIVRRVYAGFADGDMAAVVADFADNVVWNEAENSPYADRNPYEGSDEIVSGLFARLGGEWEYFNATPSDYIAEGDKVVAIGRYTAEHGESGKSMDIPFVHVWTVENGDILAFQQYTDTLTHTEVMQTD
ncbi:MAG: nuclear transport factor 2 family protein [Pseudomonadota bacterium]|nr:nuclear transport factor 2 family protein [Pseudomonadota bacterium]